MLVRCPECLESIELSADTTFREIDCPSCGSAFDLVGDENENFTEENSTIAHFKLSKQLGQGGFGAVWLARDTELERDVAIKIPRGSRLKPEEQERFLREARAVAQLKHPNIVNVHEVGKEGDLVYVVSDYIEGMSLSEWLSDQQLTARESAELCAKIAEALHYAHESGIVHRDVKPGNIMMDVDGEPHILDFGLAKRDTNEVTLTIEGRILGTPAYMSPEQAKGEGYAADRRADVYSLGVVLFQLLTGEVPFRGNIRMLIHQIINEEPASPRKFNTNIPKDLETICLRCIQKNPNRRYQTADDVASDLRHWLKCEPITARPVGRIERSMLWCRRHVAVSILMFLGLSLLSGIAGITTVAYFREVGFRNEIENALGEAKQAQTVAEVSQKRAVDAQNAAIKQSEASRLQSYVSDMNSAPHTWSSGADELLQVSLNRHIPQTGEPDNRSFEWYYWRKRSKESLWSLKPSKANHAKYFTSHKYRRIPVQFAFMPHDKTMVVSHKYANASYGMALRDSETGQFIKTIKFPSLADVPHKITSVGNSKEQMLLSVVSRDNRLHLFDPVSNIIRKTFKETASEVTAACFSDDAKLFAFCLSDGTVQIHDVFNDKQVSSFQVKVTKPRDTVLGSYPWRLAFSPTGNLLAVSSLGLVPVAIHDVATGKLKTTIHSDWVANVVFTNREDRIITANSVGLLRLWDLAGPKVLASVQAHKSQIPGLVASKDRSLVATAGIDQHVYVWNSETLDKRAAFRGHTSGVQDVIFSKDGRFLYTGSITELMKWDLTRKMDPTFFATVQGPAQDLNTSTDNQNLAVNSGSLVRVLNTENASEKSSFNQGEPVFSSMFSPNGKWLVSAGRKNIKLWNLMTDSLQSQIEVPGPPLLAQVISPDSDWLVAGGGHRQQIDSDGFLLFVDIATKKQWRIEHKHSAITGIAFLDPHRFVTISAGGQTKIEIWSLKVRAIKASINSPGVPSLIGISPAKDLMAVRAGANHIFIYQTDSLKEVAKLTSIGGFITDLAFLSDGRTLAVADSTKEIKLWDVRTHQPVGMLLDHKTPVTRLATANNPPRLYSWSHDGEIRVWHGGP